PGPWVARLRYAYADALLAVGRAEVAREWFARAVEADTDVVTDAADRLLALDGVALEEAASADDAEPATDADPGGDAATTAPGPGTPPAALIDAYDVVVLDLDGVVYVGDEAVPGAVEAIERLRRAGRRVVYATNNASRSAEEVAAALTKLGVDADAGDVVTS